MQRKRPATSGWLGAATATKIGCRSADVHQAPRAKRSVIFPDNVFSTSATASTSNVSAIGVAGEPAYTEITPTAVVIEQLSRGLVCPLVLQVAELEIAPITAALLQCRGNEAAETGMLRTSRAKLYR